MEEIYTSYAVSLKPRKIPTRVWLKYKNLRVVNHATAYLHSCLLFEHRKRVLNHQLK